MATGLASSLMATGLASSLMATGLAAAARRTGGAALLEGRCTVRCALPGCCGRTARPGPDTCAAAGAGSGCAAASGRALRRVTRTGGGAGDCAVDSGCGSAATLASPACRLWPAPAASLTLALSSAASPSSPCSVGTVCGLLGAVSGGELACGGAGGAGTARGGEPWAVRERSARVVTRCEAARAAVAAAAAATTGRRGAAGGCSGAARVTRRASMAARRGVPRPSTAFPGEACVRGNGPV